MTTDVLPPEEARSLVALDEARRQIALAREAGDVAFLKDLRDQAQAITHYHRRRADSRELANDAGEIKVRAEGALGALDLDAAPHGRPGKANSDVTFSAPLADMRPNTRALWRDLGELSPGELSAAIEQARRQEDYGVTTATVHAIAQGIDLGGLKAAEHVEWYTPARYVEAARNVLGGIDLDPASSAQANETVQAETYYDEDDDGLAQDWHGRVWLNPPYGKGTGMFASKLVEEYDAGRVTAAVFLINAYGFDSAWFQPLWNHPICFTDHRIEFSSPQHKSGGPANANIFVYLGPDRRRFIDVFGQFGTLVERV